MAGSNLNFLHVENKDGRSSIVKLEGGSNDANDIIRIIAIVVAIILGLGCCGLCLYLTLYISAKTPRSRGEYNGSV